MRYNGLFLALVMLSVASCGKNGPKGGIDFCTVAAPTLLSPQDVLTRPTEDKILSDNEFWESQCAKGPVWQFR